MKLMFNTIGGKQIKSSWDCSFCVFRGSPWCNSIKWDHPLYRSCRDVIWFEDSLDIFNL